MVGWARRNHATIGTASATATVAVGLACSLFGGTPSPQELADANLGLLQSGPRGRILEIDGKNLYSRDYELAPGAYDVLFKYSLRGEEVSAGARDMRVTLICHITLAIEAGHIYRIERTDPELGPKRVNVASWRQDFTYQVGLIDVESGKWVVTANDCEPD